MAVTSVFLVSICKNVQNTIEGHERLNTIMLDPISNEEHLRTQVSMQLK